MYSRPLVDISNRRSPVAAVPLVCIALLTGALSCGGDKPDDNPVDKTRPTVISTSPVDGDSTVSVDAVISVTFSEPMDAGVMLSGVLTLDPPAGGVTGYSNRVLTFTPSTALDTNVTYAATVSTAVSDTAGNPLAAPYVWSFSTYRDTIPPTVMSTVPAPDDSATVNTVITINFSERMDVSTLNSGTILFDPAVVGSLSIQNNRQVIITPNQPLDTFTTYTATVTTAARDSAGNYLAADHVWQFRTVPDWIPPVALLVRPLDQAVFQDSVRLQVAASDDDRMSHVEFFADGILIPGSSSSAGPDYEYTWRPTGLVLGSEHSLYAVAYDEAGNQACTDTVTVHYLWWLLVEDNNEAIPRNLARLYCRTTQTRVSFRVETWNGWGEYKDTAVGIDVAIFLDTDQDSTTGDRRTGFAGNETEVIGDIGADYKIVVVTHGDSLSRWTGSAWAHGSAVDELIISNNSNFFEVSVALARIVEPQFIDLIAANVNLSTREWDWAPNVNLGHVTAIVDHAYPGPSPSGQIQENESNQAAPALISPFD